MEETLAATMPDPTEPPEPLYRLQGVERFFRMGASVVRAVDDVDLALYPGEFVAIEGPSGSGKSTMLQLLGGLDRPTGGQVLFNGRDLASLGDGELTAIRATEIGFVFQAFNLIPTLTASENVEIAMVPVVRGKAERQARAANLLAQVGLAERARHLPSLLSGGEQQRVAIARAMANHPRVILADEPTGNLDTRSTAEIGAILRSLATDQGVTVIVVTHSEAVASWAARRLRMRDGKLFEMTLEDIAASAAAGLPQVSAPPVAAPAVAAPAVAAPAVAAPAVAAPAVAAPAAGVTGLRLLLYSPEAQALQAQLKELFAWPDVDAGDGWPTFALPPAELGVHPCGPGEAHQELSLLCDDLAATVAALQAKGVSFAGEPEERGFGLAVTMRLAGGVDIVLYQPRHPTAI
jgi:putative ABC transport system ATP-binding protein